MTINALESAYPRSLSELKSKIIEDIFDNEEYDEDDKGDTIIGEQSGVYFRKRSNSLKLEKFATSEAFHEYANTKRTKKDPYVHLFLALGAKTKGDKAIEPTWLGGDAGYDEDNIPSTQECFEFSPANKGRDPKRIPINTQRRLGTQQIDTKATDFSRACTIHRLLLGIMGSTRTISMFWLRF